MTSTHSMSFERFLKGYISNRMLQAYVTLVRELTSFKKTCTTLGYMEIIVFEIRPGGAKPYLSNGLKVRLNFVNSAVAYWLRDAGLCSKGR